jgi:hypothetical protein
MLCSKRDEESLLVRENDVLVVSLHPGGCVGEKVLQLFSFFFGDRALSTLGRGERGAAVVVRDVEAVWDGNIWVDGGEGAVDLVFVVLVFTFFFFEIKSVEGDFGMRRREVGYGAWERSFIGERGKGYRT